MVSIQEIVDDKATPCRTVLDDLPEWFGLPAALDDYVQEARSLKVFGAFDGPDCVGVLTLKKTSEANVEVHVMGVLRHYHRKGIGRQLIQQAVVYARDHHFRALSVKTLGPSHIDPHYAMTRAFYESMGFVPIEEFETLWSNGYPCLLMVKPLI